MICFYDIKYNDDILRHNKGALFVDNFYEAINFLESYFGKEVINSVCLRWAGKPGQKCKTFLNFSESEFDSFELFKDMIENDHSETSAKIASIIDKYYQL